MDVRDKLLFEPEYAGNVKEKIPPKSSLRIPWSWFPSALCLLQEVYLACALVTPFLSCFISTGIFIICYKNYECWITVVPIQVGESKLVLDIGRARLNHQDAKPYTHDLLLSMALAEVINVNKEVRTYSLILYQPCYTHFPHNRCFLEVCNCKDWL